MKTTTLALALALMSTGGAVFAADATQSRQDRMDAAYRDYQNGGRGSSTASGSADTSATGNVKEDARRFGKGMKRAAKSTGHDIAQGSRKVGHDFAQTGRNIKHKVTKKKADEKQ